MHEDMSTTSKPSRLSSSPPPSVSFARTPFSSTLTESEVIANAMWGRFGSTLTVCASPMWLVSPISFGSAGSVMSMISRPPCAEPARPKSPSSWQRPLASLASISSCASWLTTTLLPVFRIDAALGRRLDVVLQAERADRVARAGGGGVAGDEARRHDTAAGELQDRLPTGVGPGAEGAGGHVCLAALREEVDVGVRVAGREGRDHLPGRARAAGLEARVGDAGGEGGVRVVEGDAVAGVRRACRDK